MLKLLSKNTPLVKQIRTQVCYPCCKPSHLICFKQWTADMVMEILISAMNLKYRYRNTHCKRLDVLTNAKVMILQEVHEPILNMAVSKAATFLGAYDVNITDQLVWDHDYHGSIFSYMADIIFVSTSTHMCLQRFADKSSVPVMCMKSRTHASIQALSTIMAVLEEVGTLRNINVAYVGPCHPVLNSYLLLCPMLGANIRFKCCCSNCPVSPVMYHISEKMTAETHTVCKQCKQTTEALTEAAVVISGPTTLKADKITEFKLNSEEIGKLSCVNWIYFHTCPRGEEVGDELFWNCKSRTFNAFENMQYIAAALMAYAIRKYTF